MCNIDEKRTEREENKLHNSSYHSHFWFTIARNPIA